MKSKELDPKKATGSRMRLDDGFGNSGSSELTWPSNREDAQNLHYLHGAIHLHLDPLTRTVIKLKRSSSKILLDEVRDHIDQGKAPHVVIGATFKEKLDQIHSSRYLTFCLDSLRKNSDNMLIYGSSLKDNDDHIFDALRSSTTKEGRRFVISYYVSDENPTDFKERAKKKLTKAPNNGPSPDLKFLKVE